MWFVVLVRILWLLVAVHFVSELTKFELIITTFEHNYVYLSPTFRINVFTYEMHYWILMALREEWTIF